MAKDCYIYKVFFIINNSKTGKEVIVSKHPIKNAYTAANIIKTVYPYNDKNCEITDCTIIPVIALETPYVV